MRVKGTGKIISVVLYKKIGKLPLRGQHLSLVFLTIWLLYQYLWWCSFRHFYLLHMRCKVFNSHNVFTPSGQSRHFPVFLFRAPSSACKVKCSFLYFCSKHKLASFFRGYVSKSARHIPKNVHHNVALGVRRPRAVDFIHQIREENADGRAESLYPGLSLTRLSLSRALSDAGEYRQKNNTQNCCFLCHGFCLS